MRPSLKYTWRQKYGAEFLALAVGLFDLFYVRYSGSVGTAIAYTASLILGLSIGYLQGRNKLSFIPVTPNSWFYLWVSVFAFVHGVYVLVRLLQH